MANDDLKIYQEVLNDVLDLKIKDFFILCAESGVNFSLVTSAISVCLFELACKNMFDKRN